LPSFGQFLQAVVQQNYAVLNNNTTINEAADRKLTVFLLYAEGEESL
jgi:hypothetical protein